MGLLDRDGKAHKQDVAAADSSGSLDNGIQWIVNIHNNADGMDLNDGNSDVGGVFRPRRVRRMAMTLVR